MLFRSQKEVELKEKKLAMDAAAEADRIEIEKARIEAQERIAGVQAGVRAAADKARLDADMEAKGVELGSKIAKDRMEFGQFDKQHALSVHQALNPPKKEKPAKKGD
mgnify:FL=1